VKIGIVGYQASGKSTLFEWLTGVSADPSQTHVGQSAMAQVPDKRIDQLCEIYQPKKVTLASLELVDTPGLSRTHEGNAARFGLIREAGCLVVVVGAYDQSNPLADLKSFEEDLFLADLEIVAGRIERLRESVKKPRPTRAQDMAELEAIEPLASLLESGKSLAPSELSEEQAKAIRSYGLLTLKPRMAIFNVADDEPPAEPSLPRAADSTIGFSHAIAMPVRLQEELSHIAAAERQEMIDEMGLVVADRGAVLSTILQVSGQQLFFTTSHKEVRSWMIHTGATALEAAASIHTDLARGFIRAEVMKCDDLVRLGSEREMKAHHLVRQEPRDYVVQDGDIVLIKFSV
jgi:GTP-binding protein YchF